MTSSRYCEFVNDAVQKVLWHGSVGNNPVKTLASWSPLFSQRTNTVDKCTDNTEGKYRFVDVVDVVDMILLLYRCSTDLSKEWNCMGNIGWVFRAGSGWYGVGPDSWPRSPPSTGAATRLFRISWKQQINACKNPEKGRLKLWNMSGSGSTFYE